MRASDRAYAALREDIIEWRLVPGTVLGEVEQSARLGVSRTPLREALARLSAEGLTVGQAGRGVVVTAISLDQVQQLFELRIALDCQGAALAAERRPPDVFESLQARLNSAAGLLDSSDPERRAYYALVAELDTAIDDAAGNTYLLQAQRRLRTQLVRVRRLARDDDARLSTAAAEHALIARAIADGDAALAVSATRVHLSNSLSRLTLSGSTELREPHPREETVNGQAPSRPRSPQ